MGLTDEQKKERAEAMQGIIPCSAKGEKDYVFISYKSDDWEVVLNKVVRYMVENYGLKVYFDKNFDSDNDSWVKNMKDAIATRKCRAVLAFVSKKYMVSYACLMELLTARSKLAQMNKDNHKKLQIIPIIIDHSGSVQEAMSKSGEPLDIKEWEWKEYVALLKNIKENPWLDKNGGLDIWLDSLIDGMELTEERISSVAETILREGHERTFTENSFEPGFFENLKEAIEKCSKDVFDPGLIKKKTTTPADADAASKDSSETKSVKTNFAKKEPEKTNSAKTESVSLLRELHPELKIGELVQQVLKKLLVTKATEEEIRLMQEAEYSKTTFGITYPLLVKSSQPFDRRRYYSEVIEIRGEQYHLCSQWFETPANNDRPYVEKWIREHQ